MDEGGDVVVKVRVLFEEDWLGVEGVGVGRVIRGVPFLERVPQIPTQIHQHHNQILTILHATHAYRQRFNTYYRMIPQHVPLFFILSLLTLAVLRHLYAVFQVLIMHTMFYSREVEIMLYNKFLETFHDHQP